MEETIEKCYERVARIMRDYSYDEQYSMTESLCKKLRDRADRLLQLEYQQNDNENE